MNGTETMAALCGIANKWERQYEEALAALPKEAKLERKALIIQKNMASHCGNFARIEYNGHIYDTRERMVFVQHHRFDSCRSAYDALEGGEREMFLVWAHAVTMVRHCFYDSHREALAKAEENGEAETVFEQRLICGTVGQILDEWYAWWKQNGVMKCGEI